MLTRNYKPEQIVGVLRKIEVQIANGKTAPQACKEAGIHTQTYSRSGAGYRLPGVGVQKRRVTATFRRDGPIPVEGRQVSHLILIANSNLRLYRFSCAATRETKRHVKTRTRLPSRNERSVIPLL